ncbi:helix-turn-helix domain-containing protein [Thalassobacillus sp. C254]|uniref:helix-turn-helix domain-containing protein n=1 Tax=Thalassobacillus sp. C254 TaxID=1225341 RepID=UPI0006D1344D|nr:helix-turn-helix transcriptional regulator [Thalassobacillus sp. C254]
MEYKLIGQTIKQIRQRKKITQKALAQGICTQAQISKIENGEVIPLSITLYEIAKKLGVDINYFFEVSTSPRSDYINETKTIIREAIDNIDYQTVYEVVSSEEKNPLFHELEDRQFLLWHKGIALYHLKNKYEESLELLYEALHLRDEHSKTLYSKTEVEIFNSIGVIFLEKENYAASIPIFNEGSIIYLN